MKWLIIILIVIIGIVFALIDAIKVSAHPVLFSVLLALALAALAVGAFFFLRYLLKSTKKAKNKSDEETAPPAPQPVKQEDLYEFYRVKTAGVTFNNDDGTSRQDLIRKMYYHEPPFEDKEAELALERYEYRGRPAYKVLVNDCQIGNLSKTDAEYVDANMDRFVTLCGAEIVGGDKPKDHFFDDVYDDDYDDTFSHRRYDDYDDDDDIPLNWGFHFNIKFKK